jgi:hypothetical protein
MEMEQTVNHVFELFLNETESSQHPRRKNRGESQSSLEESSIKQSQLLLAQEQFNREMSILDAEYNGLSKDMSFGDSPVKHRYH